MAVNTSCWVWAAVCKSTSLCLRQSFASRHLQNISTEELLLPLFSPSFTVTVIPHFFLIDLKSIKIKIMALMAPIIKYKLFSTSSIRLVRSPHWHWHSGLDMLFSPGELEVVFILQERYTVSFSTAQCYFSLSLWCQFSQCIHRIPSFPVNTHHSFLFKTGRVMGI